MIVAAKRPASRRLLTGIGICSLLCIASFCAGMVAQARMSSWHQRNIFAPFVRDPYTMQGLSYDKIVALQFDRNIKYPWSKPNVANGYVELPSGATALYFQKSESSCSLPASEATLRQALKEQIEIDAGQIIRGELYTKNGKPCYVDCPEERRIISDYSPQFILNHFARFWNYSDMKARCHMGERLMEATIDPYKGAPQAGTKLIKRVYLSKYLDPVWEWTILKIPCEIAVCFYSAGPFVGRIDGRRYAFSSKINIGRSRSSHSSRSCLTYSARPSHAISQRRNHAVP